MRRDEAIELELKSAEPSRAPDLELTVEVVRTYDGLLGLAADYASVQRASRNELPFLLHEWHGAWCRHLLRDNARVRAQPAIFVARTAGGECAGIVPMILTERSIGAVRCRALDLIGPDPAITEIRAPLVLPGIERSLARALQRELAADRNWDWVHWSGLDPAFARALADSADLRRREPLVAHVLDLAPSWEQFRAGLKRNIRESLRHGYNSLKRDGLEFEFRVVDEPDRIGPALERFFVLHAARSHADAGTAHPNHFAAAPLRDFLVDACTQLARRGAACVFQLVIDEAVVATRIGFVVGDSLYLYYSGFDPQWGRYGVMTTTVAEAIKYAIGRGLATVNLSTGTDVSKTRWGPRSVELGAAVQVARSLKSRLAYELYQRARAQKRLPRWLGERIARRSWD